MSGPLVSVVMGTYNQERYVREALDSVFDQTFQDYEVIIADDASTDKTVEILKSYGDSITLLQRSTNSGRCQFTRNMCIHEARGKYIAFLDHDDTWLPEKLEKQVQFMAAHEQYLLSHTYCRLMDEQSAPGVIRHEGGIPGSGSCYNALLEHCFLTMSSVMIQKKIFNHMGMFNEALPVLSEDYEYFMRAQRITAFGFIDEPLTLYRKSADQITAKYWKYIPETQPFYRWLLDQPALWHGVYTQSDIRDRLVKSCIHNAIFWRSHGYPKRALQCSWEACRYGRMRMVALRAFAAAVMQACKR